jgi:hypothetical protein
MKNIFFIVLFSVISQAQTFKTDKIVVDKTTKLPLSNVSVYNNQDNSITNNDGVFVFVSNNNEIYFDLLGYTPVKSTFDDITKLDTIFMEPKTFVLDEVIVTNLEPFMKKVFDKIGDNYISNYTVNFFLRNILKRDNNVVKLQDISAKRIKNQGNVDDEIEVLNMRKTSLLDKEEIGDLKFPNFNEFFSPPIIPIDNCLFTEENYYEANCRKISFETKEKTDRGQTLKGYYIINRIDYAIVEYFISMYDNPEVVPIQKIMLSGMQYRTKKYDRFVQYVKNVSLNKYYLSNSKLDSEVEVLAGNKIDKTFLFKLSMEYFTTNSVFNEKIHSNFSVDKDIFKAKFTYSADFWDNQNQLPLTLELKSFLTRVMENKDKKKEYEIIGNF